MEINEGNKYISEVLANELVNKSIDVVIDTAELDLDTIFLKLEQSSLESKYLFIQKAING